ncbi:MAG: glycosyltransferase [Bryobacteraceae bacterium]|nr:glycosyltransferase [Bryobacteraceae bacterium]
MAKPDSTPKPASAPVPPPEPVVIPLRVSVVVITRNQSEALRRTLASLERSTPRELLEILVVDAGSVDDTRDIEASFPAIKLLRTPKNFGWTKSANIGTRTAKGDYLFFLPPGVEVEADTVARLAARLDEAADVTAVCPLERNSAGETVGRSYALPTPADLGVRLRTGQWPMANAPDFPAGAPLMIRRQAIVQINYLDEKTYGQFGADVDLFHQLKRGGRRIAFAEEIPVRVSSRPTELALGTDPVDMAHGAASYIGKWHGFGAGLGNRIQFALGRLGSLDFGGFMGVLMGAKTDGQ